MRALLRIGAVSVLAVVLLTAQGCGGGGGGGSAGGVAQLRGQVILPPGSHINAVGLTVTTPMDTQPVAANGSFSVSGLGGQRSLVTLKDSAGNGIMLGYVDPAGTASTDISAKSTATALLFIATGAYSMPPGTSDGLLAELDASARVTTLAATVSARIVADPTAVQDGDAQLGTALQSAAVALVPAGKLMPRNLPAVQTVGVTARRAPRSGVTRGPTPVLLLIDPQASVQQSGIQVQQNPAGSGIIVTNNFRRNCEFEVFETGIQDASGTKTTFTTPEVVGGFHDVPATITLNIADSFEAISGSLVPWAPISSAPLDLPVDTTEPNTVETFYQVVVIGPTLLFVGPAPAIFSNPLFAPFVAGMKSEITSLYFTNLVQDFVLPVLDALGFIRLSDLVLANPAKIWVIAQRGSAIESIFKSAKDMTTAQTFLFETAFSSDSTSRQNAITIMQQVAQQSSKNVKLSEQALDSVKAPAALEELAKIGAILKAVKIATAAVDLGKIISDLTSSNVAESWTVTADQSPVRIQPNAATVSTDNPIATLAVNIPGTTDLSNFRFLWSTTGTEDSLQDTSGLNQHPVTGVLVADSSVDYVADARLKTGGSDTVTVKAFLLPDTTTPFGSAVATVTGQGVDCAELTELAMYKSCKVLSGNAVPTVVHSLFPSTGFSPGASVPEITANPPDFSARLGGSITFTVDATDPNQPTDRICIKFDFNNSSTEPLFLNLQLPTKTTAAVQVQMTWPANSCSLGGGFLLFGTDSNKTDVITHGFKALDMNP